MRGVRALPRPLLPFATAWAAGALLRLWNLRGQPLLDDELHVAAALRGGSWGELLTTYRPADVCIPLAALYRLAIAAGVPLSELALRLPVLLCGLALPLVGAWWADRRFGRAVAIRFAWLLALSPQLVFYSRIARSYAPATLLCFVAAASLAEWWRRRSTGFAAGYASCAATATWFHLGAAPLAVAPLGWAAGLVAARRGQGAGALAAVGAATAAVMLAFLVPARRTLLPLARERHGSLDVSFAELVDVAELLAGVRSPGPAAAFLALVCIGLARAWRRDRELAALAAAAIAAQVGGILYLAPALHQSEVVLARYLVPQLPWMLLAVALAVAPAREGRGAALGPVAIAALAACGPFAEPAIWRSNLFHHDSYLNFSRARPRPASAAIPEFYRALRGSRSGPVLQVPWHPVGYQSQVPPLYQERHRQEVMGALHPQWRQDPLALRNSPPLRCGPILRSRARWLVLHRDLGAEEARLPRAGIDPALHATLRELAGASHERFRRALGEPHHRDAAVFAWDLDRVRARARGAGVASYTGAPCRSAAPRSRSPARRAGCSSRSRSSPRRSPPLSSQPCRRGLSSSATAASPSSRTSSPAGRRGRSPS